MRCKHAGSTVVMQYPNIRSCVLVMNFGQFLFVNRVGVFERSANRNDAMHTTVGIDMYVTAERTIILDSQVVFYVVYSD